jgi:D-3-phosphoglycerate dehydrogenase
MSGELLLIGEVHSAAAARLLPLGLRVASATGAATLQRLSQTVVIGIGSEGKVDTETLDAAPALKAIGAFCVSTDHIDLDEATARGIAVFNAPFSNTRSVVEVALAEIIALTRRLTVHNEAMHAGRWDKSAAGSHEVRGRTLGIVGYGRIGSQLSTLAEALGMRVLFYDAVDKLPMGNAQRCGSLNELLMLSDVVSLHVDGRPGSSGTFSEEQLTLMRPGSLLLNLSRGYLLDEAALRRHLEHGHIAGAAVDVFHTEPREAQAAFTSALTGLPNVILTPHIGGVTQEAQRGIAEFVGQKLAGYLRDGTTSLSVNLPEVQLARLAGTHRFSLLHRNEAGVLATVNTTLARSGLNIEQQQLATHGQFGYAVTDVSGASPADLDDALSKLKALPAVVRAEALPSSG